MIALGIVAVTLVVAVAFLVWNTNEESKMLNDLRNRNPHHFS